MVNNSDAVIDKQLISKLMDSFVCICIAGVDCRHSYRGSGCIVSVDDLTANVVTNYHLVETVNKIVDIIGNGWSLLGRVVYVDPKLDLALIKFTNNNKNLITNYQILQSFPSFGDHMLSLGYATNDYNLCTGIIISPASVYLTDHNMSYFYSCSPGMVYIEHCVPIYSGFSGGPLIDVSNGQLCCMNCIVENGSQRFAISGDYINKFLENAHLFRESQQLRRLSEHRAIRLGMHFKWQSRGCYIVTKFLNFDETSNLFDTDIIHSINDQCIRSMDHFVYEINKYDNQTIDISFIPTLFGNKKLIIDSTITLVSTQLTFV